MNHFQKRLWHFLSVAGFSVLAGLCGIGLTWVVVALLANGPFKKNSNQFVSESMPILAAGGVIGLVVGFAVSLLVLKANPKKQDSIEKKYVGFGGRMKIYFGAPAFVVALLAPAERHLEHVVGQNAGPYVALGIVLVIIAASLAVYDRIPERLIIPIGIAGWLLTLSLILCFCLFGQASF